MVVVVFARDERDKINALMEHLSEKFPAKRKSRTSRCVYEAKKGLAHRRAPSFPALMAPYAPYAAYSTGRA